MPPQVTAKRKMRGARSDLIMTQYFWGPLAARMTMVEDPAATKLWTDMKQIGYNPEWVQSVSLDELKARIVEIVCHNANGHSWRGQGRESRDWNIACDRALWSVLHDSGFPLPNDVHYDAADKGLSAEAIYQRIHYQPKPNQGQPSAQPGTSQDDGSQPQQQQSSGTGSGHQQHKGAQPPQQDKPDDGHGDQQPQNNQPKKTKPDPGSGGEVRPAPREEEQQLRDDWKIAVLQAAQVAKQHGHLPAGLEALLDSIAHPQVDWKAALRRFLAETARDDYRWQRPNRRYINRGLYMPEIRSNRAPAFAVLWDTSGSLYSKELQEMIAAEVESIFYEVQPERLYVIYTDTIVQRVDVFYPGDTVVWRPKGGGGTDFKAVFQYIEEGERADIRNAKDLQPIDLPIAELIGISDLYASFPDSAPDYPVLWAATTERPAPFGEVLRIKE